MSADLNYSIKRLVRGLVSDNHLVKRGFYLSLSQVLSRFKKQTDPLKFLRFVADECRTSKGMKNPEVNALIIGKMMCLTATVESQLYQTSVSQLNHDALNMATNDLLQMYKDHDYVRESIQAILVKVLSQITPLT
jgi:hypothetical protein